MKEKIRRLTYRRLARWVWEEAHPSERWDDMHGWDRDDALIAAEAHLAAIRTLGFDVKPTATSPRKART